MRLHRCSAALINAPTRSSLDYLSSCAGRLATLGLLSMARNHVARAGNFGRLAPHGALIVAAADAEMHAIFSPDRCPDSPAYTNAS